MRSRSRKGQQVFEFLVATVLFIGIIIFVLNLLNANVSLYTQDYFVINREAKAIAASEALVKTTGGVGLAADWPELDVDKMTALSDRCQNSLGDVLTDLGLDHKPGATGGSYELRAEVVQLDGTSLMQCGSAAPTEGTPVSTVRRIALVKGELVRVAVSVWEVGSA